jgi:hypothetical protein
VSAVSPHARCYEASIQVCLIKTSRQFGVFLVLVLCRLVFYSVCQLGALCPLIEWHLPHCCPSLIHSLSTNPNSTMKYAQSADVIVLSNLLERSIIYVGKAEMAQSNALWMKAIKVKLKIRKTILGTYCRRMALRSDQHLKQQTGKTSITYHL